jgi:hypothetical protein
VYWITLGAGNVAKAPIAGGLVTSLAGGYTYGAGIAVDDKTIYYTTNTFDNIGTLWRLAK